MEAETEASARGKPVPLEMPEEKPKGSVELQLQKVNRVEVEIGQFKGTKRCLTRKILH